MPKTQLDLFSKNSYLKMATSSSGTKTEVTNPAYLDDNELLLAIPGANMKNGPSLVSEAGKRQLVDAIPILERYRKRFSMAEDNQVVLEQTASLRALAEIGQPAAAEAIGRLINGSAIKGPALSAAVSTAARLGAKLAGQNFADR